MTAVLNSVRWTRSRRKTRKIKMTYRVHLVHIQFCYHSIPRGIQWILLSPRCHCHLPECQYRASGILPVTKLTIQSNFYQPFAFSVAFIQVTYLSVWCLFRFFLKIICFHCLFHQNAHSVCSTAYYRACVLTRAFNKRDSKYN